MTKRYFELREFLPDLLDAFSELEDYLLSIPEENSLKTIHETMKNFQEVTFMLQKKNFSLGEMRILFDGVVQKYPLMKEYLSADANIIQYPLFESGLFNI